MVAAGRCPPSSAPSSAPKNQQFSRPVAMGRNTQYGLRDAGEELSSTPTFPGPIQSLVDMSILGAIYQFNVTGLGA